MDRSENDRVRIFDTTLRDGEQSPGISLNKQEKLEIAHQLSRLGVDIIEAGFPITSPGDFDSVQAIAREVHGPVICGLARTGKQDIDAAWNAIKDSERPRIHTFIATSDIHIERKLQTTREDVKGQARAAVAHARQYVEDVEFSPEDGSRSDIEFMAEVIQIAIDEGATTINVPDTVGYTMPDEYAEMWRRLYELVPDLAKVTASVHCHNDLGLAVANSFAGVRAGARQVECAMNGIGERAGNASLEEIVMLLHTRESSVGVWSSVNTREIARTSRLVSRLTGYPVQPNKAIVGRNAFAHEAGIHQDGVLKERTTYEIMDATTIGLETNSIVLGKHSGRHALRKALEELGFAVEGAALNTAFKRFKELADKKKKVTALDLEAIVSDEMKQAPAAFQIESFEVEASNVRAPLAKVSVRMPDGSVESGSFTGDGPVDAFFSAINAATGHDARLKEFHVSAVTGGRDALGEMTVLLELDGRTASGAGRLDGHPRGVRQGVPAGALERALRRRRGRGRAPARARGAQGARTLSATEQFTWRDGERLVRFGAGAAPEAVELMGEPFVLLTTERAAAAVPDLPGAAARVVNVRDGQGRRPVRGPARRAAPRHRAAGARRRPRDRHRQGRRRSDRSALRRRPHDAVGRRDDAVPPQAGRRRRGGPRAARRGRGRPRPDGERAAHAPGRHGDERAGARDGGALHALREPGSEHGGAAGGERCSPTGSRATRPTASSSRSARCWRATRPARRASPSTMRSARRSCARPGPRTRRRTR